MHSSMSLKVQPISEVLLGFIRWDVYSIESNINGKPPKKSITSKFHGMNSDDQWWNPTSYSSNNNDNIIWYCYMILLYDTIYGLYDTVIWFFLDGWIWYDSSQDAAIYNSSMVSWWIVMIKAIFKCLLTNIALYIVYSIKSNITIVMNKWWWSMVMNWNST